MTLKDISHGSSGSIWIGLVIFAVLSVVLLSGHGANLIAGYNTAGKEERSKVNEKKLCRVIGAGMLVIAVLIFVMALGEAVLPAMFAYVFLAAVLADCAVMIILANTICKK